MTATDDVVAAAAGLFELDPESVRCPYPILDALREAAPIVWVEQLEPTLADRLRAEPAAIPPLLEEVLRLEPPSTGLYRTTTTDHELGGVPLPAGTNVWLAYAAGNRDPEHFAEPGRCRPDRTDTAPHLGFGLGPHYCLGAGLARAEARIALETLLTRLDDIRAAVAPEAVTYDPSYLVHGIHELPLTFARTAG